MGIGLVGQVHSWFMPKNWWIMLLLLYKSWLSYNLFLDPCQHGKMVLQTSLLANVPLKSLLICSLCQVSQILKDGGRFISVTFSQPHFRKPFLAKSIYDWSISLHTFGDSIHYFFYVMEKGRPLSDNDKKFENFVKPVKREISELHALAEDREDFLLNIAL